MWQKILEQWKLIWQAQNWDSFIHQNWVIIGLVAAVIFLLARRWKLSIILVLIVVIIQVIITMSSILRWSEVTGYNILFVGITAVVVVVGLMNELFTSNK